MSRLSERVTTQIRAGFRGALMLLVLVAASVSGVTRAPSANAQAQPPPATPTSTPTAGGEVLAAGSVILVSKQMCERFGLGNTCDGRDTSLDGYSIDFNVFKGDVPEEPGRIGSA